MKPVKTAWGANSIIAVQSLVRSTQAIGRVGFDQTEAPFTHLVGGDRAQQIALAEVGPQGIGKIELCVRHLIEEEIRNAQLARSADEQIWILKAAGGELLRDRLLVGGRGVGAALW